MKTNIHHNKHQPVLLEAAISYLEPKPGDSYLDLTAGYGGHAQAVIERTHAPDKAVLVDRDADAIKHLSQVMHAANIIKSDFLQAARDLANKQTTFDVILMDVGVSSPHLDKAERGFSFKLDGPLDMRMDRSQELTAETIVNDWSLPELTRVIRDYGQEPKAARIAQAITGSRPIGGTAKLAQVIADVYGNRRLKIHPATRTFQALRIAVNDELVQLEETLKLLPDLMNPGARLAIITFHSLEDRIVKNWLKEESSSGYEARLSVLTKRPISGKIEDVHNPRARSAKLRAAAKIKTERDTHAN